MCRGEFGRGTGCTGTVAQIDEHASPSRFETDRSDGIARFDLSLEFHPDPVVFQFGRQGVIGDGEAVLMRKRSR